MLLWFLEHLVFLMLLLTHNVTFVKDQIFHFLRENCFMQFHSIFVYMDGYHTDEYIMNLK